MQALDAPYLQTGFWQLVKKRAGWLAVLFFGEMLTASAMGRFEDRCVPIGQTLLVGQGSVVVVDDETSQNGGVGPNARISNRVVESLPGRLAELLHCPRGPRLEGKLLLITVDEMVEANGATGVLLEQIQGPLQKLRERMGGGELPQAKTGLEKLLGPLPLGDVSNVALDHPGRVHRVEVADKLDLHAPAVFGLKRQVIVADVPALMESRLRGSNVAEGPDLPEHLPQEVLPGKAQQVEDEGIDVHNLAAVGVEDQDPIFGALEEPPVAYLGNLQIVLSLPARRLVMHGANDNVRRTGGVAVNLCEFAGRA
ncbi:MAG: hypothetical protein A2289_09985 [Deltaproteobacteria bacterium RIFOXYA12_FULL_58_15]|nr:MAG: hypothetical protein A2289_09985 [Deltaproteobacteria bacterium RIFOXYA12_FULL_58_15]